MARWCRKRAPARSPRSRGSSFSLALTRSREMERQCRDESRRRRKSFSSSEGCSRGRWPRFLAIHFYHRDHRSRLQCRFWGGCSLVRGNRKIRDVLTSLEMTKILEGTALSAPLFWNTTARVPPVESEFLRIHYHAGKTQS